MGSFDLGPLVDFDSEVLSEDVGVCISQCNNDAFLNDGELLVLNLEVHTS